MDLPTCYPQRRKFVISSTATITATPICGSLVRARLLCPPVGSSASHLSNQPPPRGFVQPEENARENYAWHTRELARVEDAEGALLPLGRLFSPSHVTLTPSFHGFPPKPKRARGWRREGGDALDDDVDSRTSKWESKIAKLYFQWIFQVKDDSRCWKRELLSRKSVVLQVKYSLKMPQYQTSNCLSKTLLAKSEYTHDILVEKDTIFTRMVLDTWEYNDIAIYNFKNKRDPISMSP